MASTFPQAQGQESFGYFLQKRTFFRKGGKTPGTAAPAINWLTTSEMRRARPASEVLPRLIGETAAAAILKRSRGRPPVEDKLISTTLRIPHSVVAQYQAGGADWRKRMQDAVKANVPGDK